MACVGGAARASFFVFSPVSEGEAWVFGSKTASGSDSGSSAGSRSGSSSGSGPGSSSGSGSGSGIGSGQSPESGSGPDDGSNPDQGGSGSSGPDGSSDGGSGSGSSLGGDDPLEALCGKSMEIEYRGKTVKAKYGGTCRDCKDIGLSQKVVQRLGRSPKSSLQNVQWSFH